MTSSATYVPVMNNNNNKIENVCGKTVNNNTKWDVWNSVLLNCNVILFITSHSVSPPLFGIFFIDIYCVFPLFLIWFVFDNVLIQTLV